MESLLQQLMSNHQMQNWLKKIPQQPPPNLEPALPFHHLPIDRPEHQSSEVSADTDHKEDDSSEQTRAEHPSNYCPQLEDIPELETNEENWDNGQFDDAELLNCHNSTEESDRIHREYPAYFEKVEDQEYSLNHTTQRG